MEDSRSGYHPSNKGLRNNREIGERATRFNTSKSPGPDEIHPKLLFELRDFLTQVLTKIFIRAHLMEHLEKNEILVNEQFGFLPVDHHNYNY